MRCRRDGPGLPVHSHHVIAEEWHAKNAKAVVHWRSEHHDALLLGRWLLEPREDLGCEVESLRHMCWELLDFGVHQVVLRTEMVLLAIQVELNGREILEVVLVALHAGVLLEIIEDHLNL